MQAVAMDIQKFLARIAFNQPINQDFATLCALQQHFLLAVAFENLDIHYGDQLITIDEMSCYKKIVEQKRGGLCFENNTLLAWALQQLGFQVTVLSGQMLDGLMAQTTEDKHMLLQVSLGQQHFLVDTGNGQSFRTPLAMDGSTQDCTVEGYCYRLGAFMYKNTSYQALYVRPVQETKWQVRYVYKTTPCTLNDFIGACHFQQTSPQAHFIKGPVFTLALPDGRITLTPTTTKKNCQGIIQITHHDESHFLAGLAAFGIKLNGNRKDPLLRD